MLQNKKYNYLNKYVDLSDHIVIGKDNNFESLTEEEIKTEEQRLGFRFPEQLRQFYLEIGYGNLTTPENPYKDYMLHSENEILKPSVIADIILLGHDSGYISQDVLDVMAPGDLPFFHIRDSCLFLFLKVNSSNPNAVYNEWGNLIEENFDRFIWRLYYESPTFYEEVQKS